MKEKLERYGLPSARPEFWNVTEAEAWAAATGEGSGFSQVEAEIARLAIGYLAAFKRHASRWGRAPDVLQVRTQCAVEKVALLMVVGYIDAHGGSVRALPLH